MSHVRPLISGQAQSRGRYKYYECILGTVQQSNRCSFPGGSN